MFAAIFSHLWADYTFAIIAVGVGLAIAWFGPQSAKDYGIGVAGAAVIASFVFSNGVAVGEANVQHKWDLAEQRAVTDGNAARAAAEKSIPAVVEPPALDTPAVVPPSKGNGPLSPPPNRRPSSVGVPTHKPLDHYDRG